MINLINTVFNVIFSVLFFPLHRLRPIWGLTIFSLLTGLLMIVIFKRVSDQEGIRRVKNHIKAHLLELRLYKDSAGLSLIAMKDIFLSNGKYLAFALRPMLVLMMPVMIIIIQLATRYEYHPLSVGESTVVRATVIKDIPIQNIRIEAPEGIEVETSPLRIPDKDRIFWRIRAVESGEWEIGFHLIDRNVSKQIVVGTGRTILASRRVRASSLSAFLHPSESTLPGDSFLKEISIQYPHKRLTLSGMNVHWLVFFFVVSVVTGFALKGIFKVEI